jgi:hypothetical protein
MPYPLHPSLEEPSDPNAQLWRYMDLGKLVSILVDKSLFFPSGKTLSLQDKFEGQPTYEEVDQANTLATSPPTEEIKTYEDQVLAAFNEAAPADRIQQMKTIEKIAFFNCWHMNDDESDAMWKVYDPGRQGVSIQSTVGRLRSSLAATDKSVYMGKIRYYKEPDSPPNTNIYVWRFFRKRMAFQHEKEVRAVVIDPGQRGQPGVKIPVNLDDLIGKVVISPYAEPWVAPLVKALASRLGYKFEVLLSEAAGPSPAAGFKA